MSGGGERLSLRRGDVIRVTIAGESWVGRVHASLDPEGLVALTGPESDAALAIEEFGVDDAVVVVPEAPSRSTVRRRRRRRTRDRQAVILLRGSEWIDVRGRSAQIELVQRGA